MFISYFLDYSCPVRACLENIFLTDKIFIWFQTMILVKHPLTYKMLHCVLHNSQLGHEYKKRLAIK